MSDALLSRFVVRLAVPGDPPDQVLLDRFVADRDAAAFAALVGRYGPMVLGVCRRVLGNTPDADDAFQATFLVLVRRATDVRHQDRLAGWLYGVAYRTASEARRLRARRHRREVLTGAVPDIADERATPDGELARTVERELAALPEHYRTAIAVCDLDGRSRSEAAALLGIPEGTLSSRLNTGRKRLAERLTRLGYGVASFAVCGKAPASVPGPLIDATLRTVSDTPEPFPLTLAEGVIRTMTTSWKYAGWSLLPLGLTAVVATVSLADPPRSGSIPPARVTAVSGRLVQDGPGAKKVSAARSVVVKTVPEAGSETVEPGLKEVRVTFSKEMTDQSWSWASDDGYGAPLPGDGKPFYDKDKKTCVWRVKLEPNTTYAVWLNVDRFMNFVDADGNPSVPYLLVFRTSAGKDD